MSTPNPRALAAARALKLAIERGVSPGLSVNSHPNPFFLNVAGSIDLLAAATYMVEDLERFDAALAAQKEADAKAQAAAPVKSD